MKPGFLFFILLQFTSLSLTDAAAITFWSYPSSVTGIQGQNITITFVANLSDHEANVTWQFARIIKNSIQVISIKRGKQRELYLPFDGRSSDLDLNVTQNGAIVTIKFIFSNLVKATDEVPTNIIGPNMTTVTVNETQAVHLVCNATGLPTPSINWTRDGVIVGTGSPFTTPAVTYDDDKACYTCVAYNGVLDAKTANVCLNVQYKPRNATILSDMKSTVCQNDTVNLTCTSGPANPAPSSYEFYDNGVLLGTSASNVYEATATVGLPAVNKFVCVPRNLVGSAFENGSVVVAAKVKPAIFSSPQSITLVEGSTLTLYCNASGVPAPNITWNKVSGSVVGNVNSEEYAISSVTRGQEGTYRCTASNGDECRKTTEIFNVVVNFPPENTNLTHNKSSNVFLLGEPVMLTCQSQAKPSACHVMFYQGSQLLANKSSSTCTASHVISSIQGCNEESFHCFTINEAGTGDRVYENVTVQVPPGVSVAPSSDIILMEEGESLTLSCTPYGCPTPNVTWSKTGVTSPLEEGSGGVLNHTFTSLSKQDTGTYQCTVNNGVGSPVVKTLFLNVTRKPKSTVIVKFNKSSNVFLLGEPVMLTCQSHAKPSACHVLFYQGSQLLANVSSSTCTASHVISSIQGCNEESFSCFVMNDAGSGERVYKNVTVQAPPGVNIVPSSDTIVMEEGNPLTLSCTPSGCPTPNVTWSKNGVTAPLEQCSGGGVLNHTFASLMKQDTATYQCNANNGVGSPAVKNIYLNITYKPFLTNLTSTLSNACLNDSVTLNCTTDANPPAHVYRFYLNDQLVHTSMSGVYQLNVQQEGNNTYECEPRNAVGAGKNATAIIITKANPTNVNTSSSKEVLEGTSCSLYCNVQPKAEHINVTWHKVGGGQVSSTGVYTIPSVAPADAGSYECRARNDECEVKVSNSIKITVVYKPYLTNLTSTLSNACLNDSVTLQCTTDANPPANEYRFYLNNQLVHTSMSGVYQLNVPKAGNNTYKCEPRNAVGAGTNTTVTIATKAPPQITWSSPNQTVVVGDTAVLVCNVTGSDPMNVTWSKVGCSSYPEGPSYTFTSIARGDEATYQCTAHNGNECPAATVQSSIAVMYLKDKSPATTVVEKTTLAAVFGILFALSFVLIILLIAGFLWIRRKDSKRNAEKRPKTDDERGNTNDIALQETSLNATDTETSSVPEYEQLGSRGLAASNDGITEYEALETRTQLAQLQPDILNNNPVPPYGGGDQHGRTGAEWDPSLFIYQTIQTPIGDYGSLSPSTRLPSQSSI